MTTLGNVIWLTGLSGAGKSTLANGVKAALTKAGIPAAVLDGDEVRARLNTDLGFSTEDRQENVRRVAEVARMMSEAGLVVIAALISPREQDRQQARAIVSQDGTRFFEVHVQAPQSLCEQRDVKGLYARARAGKISQFTSISAPYEVPVNPDLVVRTAEHTVQESVTEILALLQR